MKKYKSLELAFNELVPEYKTKIYPYLQFMFPYNAETRRIIEGVREISPSRAEKRWAAYAQPEELERLKKSMEGGKKKDFAIRFGFKKLGRGHFGPRADFCLLSGCFDGRVLCLQFRVVNMIGGLLYDLTMIPTLCEELGWEPKHIHIFTCSGEVMAMDGNSNQALWVKFHRQVLKTPGFQPPPSRLKPNYAEKIK